ncbi:cellulase family glycosylhydrolase [Plantactinospora siamensis]|uniref:Endoglucanase n=1 Tax=Plantactinospora siamensis TaxID=555372 RepID=A0ABV6NS35_9ACTN
MRTRLSALAAGLLALFAAVFVLAPPAQAASGLYVSGGKLMDANGNPFVMRGVSHAHVWYPQQTGAFADIASLGANTVRVVLGSGDRWTKNSPSDVANVVSMCKANRLICVLEVHDTTGYGEDSAAVSLDRAVDYWIGLKSVLAGQEPYVIINIGNEPYGNQNYGNWTSDTANAIKRLRSNGFNHTLMVDGPNWGQDWSFTMRDNAASVFNADPNRNTVFSIHMYGVYDTAAEITDYLGRFRSAGLPIVVGEFGWNHSDGNPDEDTIMSYSQANGIGYLGWSWSGNGGGVEYLDMVTNFNKNQLTSWGDRIFNGANGIRQTAKLATVYTGTPPTSTPPTSTPPTTTPPTTAPPTTAPPSTPPAGSGCTAAYTLINQWPGGFQGELKVTAGNSAISGWTVTWTWSGGQQITNSWNATLSASGSTVTARNVSYNGSVGAGASTTFGFTANGTGAGAAQSVRCTAS